MNKTILVLFVLLQATGGVFIDSGTYYIARDELYMIDNTSDTYGIEVGSGSLDSDYWLYRMTFTWFSAEIHEMFNGTEPQNETLFAQLLPLAGKNLKTGEVYDVSPNMTIYHETGQTFHAFPAEFSLTNTNESNPISSCRITMMWTLEWEYRAGPDYTLIIVGIVAVIMLVVIPLYCRWRRRKSKNLSKQLAEKKRLQRKEKRQEKESRKLRGKK